MSELQYLLLNGNRIHGQVPTKLSALNKLIALFLDGNTKLAGDVSFLCDAVDDLDLIFVECNGTIPWPIASVADAVIDTAGQRLEQLLRPILIQFGCVLGE